METILNGGLERDLERDLERELTLNVKGFLCGDLDLDRLADLLL